MSRSIKFRQRNKNNGSFWHWGMLNGIWENPKRQDNYIHPSESDQFTGLLDRNGKEIWEGDIVRDSDGSMGQIEYGAKDYPSFIIRYFKPQLDEGHSWIWSQFVKEELEVVGDIYSNPELLK